jgi:hypothetical protein
MADRRRDARRDRRGRVLVRRGASADVPTAAVERGTFVDAVPIRGEIKAGRSVTIIAPADAGELRIVKLAKNGSR